MSERFEAWVDAYALPLLRWALGRTGNHHQAEELAQEVWLQFFAAVRREEQACRPVEQPGHLLWKVARFVWCRQLRDRRYHPGTIPMPDAQEDFASALAEKGVIRIREGHISPGFVVFSGEQYRRLKEIFAPLEEKLQPALQRMAEDLHSLCRAALPVHLEHLAPFNEAMDLMDISFMTELIAFREGYLYKPADQRDGAFLTMCYVRP